MMTRMMLSTGWLLKASIMMLSIMMLAYFAVEPCRLDNVVQSGNKHPPLAVVVKFVVSGQKNSGVS